MEAGFDEWGHIPLLVTLPVLVTYEEVELPDSWAEENQLSCQVGIVVPVVADIAVDIVGHKMAAYYQFLEIKHVIERKESGERNMKYEEEE